jgi:hypothetical protein
VVSDKETLMPDRDDVEESIKQIAALLAEAYLRLTDQSSPSDGLASSVPSEPSWNRGLTK